MTVGVPSSARQAARLPCWFRKSPETLPTTWVIVVEPSSGAAASSRCQPRSTSPAAGQFPLGEPAVPTGHPAGAHPGQVHVPDRSEIGDQVVQRPDVAAVPGGAAGQQHGGGGILGLGQSVGLRRADADRLLHEHRDAPVQEERGHLGVQVVGHGHDGQVDVGRVEVGLVS